MLVANIGAACFGLVIGWITYRTLRWRKGPVALSDIGIVIAAVGGGATTAIFVDPQAFGYYAIGLAAGFFGYIAVAALTGQQARTYMGD